MTAMGLLSNIHQSSVRILDSRKKIAVRDFEPELGSKLVRVILNSFSLITGKACSSTLAALCRFLSKHIF